MPFFFLFLCTVTDFSAGALPIGVKFYMAVRPDLRQVFSHFGWIAPGMAESWASMGGQWRDVLLAVVHLWVIPAGASTSMLPSTF